MIIIKHWLSVIIKTKLGCSMIQTYDIVGLHLTRLDFPYSALEFHKMVLGQSSPSPICSASVANLWRFPFVFMDFFITNSGSSMSSFRSKFRNFIGWGCKVRPTFTCFMFYVLYFVHEIIEITNWNIFYSLFFGK